MNRLAKELLRIAAAVDVDSGKYDQIAKRLKSEVIPSLKGDIGIGDKFADYLNANKSWFGKMKSVFGLDASSAWTKKWNEVREAFQNALNLAITISADDAKEDVTQVQYYINAQFSHDYRIKMLTKIADEMKYDCTKISSKLEDLGISFDGFCNKLVESAKQYDKVIDEILG